MSPLLPGLLPKVIARGADESPPCPGLRNRAVSFLVVRNSAHRLRPGRVGRRGALGMLAAAGAYALGAGPRAAACEIFPPDGRRHFLILRQGQVVGHHRIAFSRPAPSAAQPAGEEAFVVRSDVEIRAGLLGTTTYRFTHYAEETWRDGWLHALVSDTDDEGRRYRVRAERRRGIFSGAVNGAGFTVSGYIVPSSLWHHDTIASEALLDTTDGRVKIVRARPLGEEEVPVAGGRVLARHYALEGQIQRQLWYDAQCRLVRAAYLARDGTWLTLEES